MAYRPVIGITLGDPASIGPEIVVKAVAGPVIRNFCRPLVVGDAMDIMGGAAISRGPRNIIAPAYFATPVSITSSQNRRASLGRSRKKSRKER